MDEEGSLILKHPAHKLFFFLSERDKIYKCSTSGNWKVGINHHLGIGWSYGI